MPAIVTPNQAGVARSTIGSPQISAAPRKAPSRLPSPPMITMNRMRKDWLTPKLSDSALPSQRKTIIAPARPQ